MKLGQEIKKKCTFAPMEAGIPSSVQHPAGTSHLAHYSRFTFSGKERDAETGLSYFGARYYDADLLTGWLSVDPMADKYPSMSPYNYCAGNPVKLVDPDGEEIDVSELYKNGKARKGCESFCRVFEYFAQSKIGISFLGQFAKKGQTIAGHTYDKDGRFHSDGIDLKIKYGRSEYSADPRSGYTRLPKSVASNERYKLTIHILPMTSSGDELSLLETFCHESFIHTWQFAQYYHYHKNESKPECRVLHTSNEKQELNDINNNHYMRDKALPLMTNYTLNGKKESRENCIDRINQTTTFNSNRTWSTK